MNTKKKCPFIKCYLKWKQNNKKKIFFFFFFFEVSRVRDTKLKIQQNKGKQRYYIEMVISEIECVLQQRIICLILFHHTIYSYTSRWARKMIQRKMYYWSNTKIQTHAHTHTYTAPWNDRKEKFHSSSQQSCVSRYETWQFYFAISLSNTKHPKFVWYTHISTLYCVVCSLHIEWIGRHRIYSHDFEFTMNLQLCARCFCFFPISHICIADSFAQTLKD